MRTLMARTIASVAAVAVAMAALADSADTVRVSLITCYPGEEIYELYGHTMLRVVTPSEDVVYNYGVFDFHAPNFIYRFVKGETDYMVRAFPTAWSLRGYLGRKVVEQELDLTPAQAMRAKTDLEVNALPENCTYRYNYVLDNCATRPRDIVEQATGGKLSYQPMPRVTTFRRLMWHYNANYAWQRLGIDLALGSGLDYELTYREQMFVPMILMEAFAGATVERDGGAVPLVSGTRVLMDGSDDGAILPATPWYCTPMALAIVLLFAVAGATAADLRRRRTALWLDTLLYIAYGITGCVLFFLIFISTHEATSPNFSGLWLHPFYLILAALLWIKPARKAAIALSAAVFAVNTLTLALWWALPQAANPAFFPLMAVPAVRALSYTLINSRLQKTRYT